jgi:hypothetical protein
LISDYAIVVDEHGGSIYPVSLLKFAEEPQHTSLRFRSRYYEETNAWVASLGQGYPTSIDRLELSDTTLSKLVHDYYRVENMRETIAGLTVPLHFAPTILSILLAMSSILLIGMASALNMARHQARLLTEEYGWTRLWALIFSLVAFSVVIFLNIIVQFMLRQSIRGNEANEREREAC